MLFRSRREGFGVEIRIVASNLCEDEAFRIECERIRFWRSHNIDLANHTAGGEGISGFKFNDETKLKLSISAKKRFEDPKQREIISKASKGNKKWLGRKHTDEAKEKISKAAMGKQKRLGAVLSDDTKAKIGAANKGNKYCLGRHMSQETRDKIRKAHLLRWALKKELDNAVKIGRAHV